MSEPTTKEASKPKQADGSDFIVFDQVVKAFGPKKIYDDLTLTVKKGETLTLLGGSGTGKSVLLRMLIGLLKPDSGTVTVEGQDITNYGEAQLLPIRKSISMLFQGGALFDSLTVGDNIAYPLREHFKYSDAEIRDKVAEKLELVGMPGIEAQKPADLSGGMRKRVALARALAGDPQMVLYDEPTTGLDPVNTRRISELILSVHDKLKITQLVVTHDMPSALMVSNRMAMLFERKILAVLTRDEFRDSKLKPIRDFVDAMSEDHKDDLKDAAPTAKPSSQQKQGVSS